MTVPGHQAPDRPATSRFTPNAPLHTREMGQKSRCPYADIGTGDSDYTAQAKIGLSYALDKFDLTFGYRYLRYALDGPALDELEISGPYVGAIFRF